MCKSLTLSLFLGNAIGQRPGLWCHIEADLTLSATVVDYFGGGDVEGNI